jgi:hypothetical protein
MLNEDVDPIPCPACGWYQKAMIPLLRRERLRWMPSLAKGCLVAALFAFAAGVVGQVAAIRGQPAAAQLPDTAPAWTYAAWVVAAALVLLCPGLYVLRWALNRSYDPNTKAKGSKEQNAAKGTS